LLFGESEAVARAFALLICAAWVVVNYFLVKITCGRRIALATTLVFLSLPAFFSFTRLVQGTALAMLLIEASLLAFIKATQDHRLHREWAQAGGVAVGLGVLTSWEPLLVAPTLIVVAVCQRDR